MQRPGAEDTHPQAVLLANSLNGQSLLCRLIHQPDVTKKKLRTMSSGSQAGGLNRSALWEPIRLLKPALGHPTTSFPLHDKVIKSKVTTA